jgi:fructoselysine 6-kinase
MCENHDMDKAEMRIVSVGECTIDHYLDLDRKFIGGISLNFAVNSRRCGAGKVSLVSGAGEDFGARIHQCLALEGVDASCVSIHRGRTARQDIRLSGAERIFPPGGYDPGILADFRLKENDLAFINSHNVIAAPLFKQSESLFHQAMSSSPQVAWRVADFLDLSDYNSDLEVVRRFSRHLTIAFLSGAQETVERLRAYSHSTPCLLVVTLGASGSAALQNGKLHLQPPIDAAAAMDSTGCGDAFQAAFTVSYWEHADVKRALQAGAGRAARVLQHYGAIGYECS